MSVEQNIVKARFRSEEGPNKPRFPRLSLPAFCPNILKAQLSCDVLSLAALSNSNWRYEDKHLNF